MIGNYGAADDEAPRGRRRAVNRAKRVAALLDSAHRLVEEGGSTDFTMQQLAAAAGLSLATTYNIIGTKAAVLYALLDAGLDSLAEAQRALQAAEPERRLEENARTAVRFFANEERYYRPLMRYLLGIYEPEKRPLFMARAIAFWRIAVSGGASDGQVALSPTPGETFARALHVSFIGALDLWVHHEIDREAFEEIVIEHLDMLRTGFRHP